MAWKLALVCKGLASRSLLETYTEERVPVIREMLRLTTGLLNKAVANTADANIRPLALRQLGVNCRWSSIVRDEVNSDAPEPGSQPEETGAYKDVEPRVLYAGDRAPDAPGLLDEAGTSHRLFDLFKPTHHTVIVFDVAFLFAIRAAGYPEGTVLTIAITQDPQSVKTSADQLILQDSQGHAQTAYGQQRGVRVAIVRPDGVVGALLREAEGVAVYFGCTFNTTASA